MNNKTAMERAQKAVSHFMSIEDEGGSPIQQDMASWEVERAILDAIAYAFKQGPKPYWWDDIKEEDRG